MTNKIIEIKDLTFGFKGAPTPLFLQAHYKIPAGKLTFVQGKNGAGKSTLFSILMAEPAIQKQVSGTLCIDNHTYNLQDSSYATFVHNQVTLVSQKFDEQLVPELTFQENLACAQLGTYPSAFSFLTTPSIPPLAHDFNLSINTPVHMLSGGQRQVLAILMGLQRPTKLLLLDEPTATLDERNAHLVMNFITSLIAQTGITVLMICHDSSLYEYTDSPTLLIEK